ncbi:MULTISPECIES: 1,4-alpha-glucan branching protein [unclassified Nocardia]|uniref:maltokinase N-terminal cap-like domain-containing protein n=1 Tax=unclassified Nocardia TaxID=2637762 RepID=UPI001CE4605F|nr:MULTISPECIES: 1,4-alpha-glucan branching protein [unclassified Nocardia]
MAVIHHTTITPTKLELLAAWLPSRPWYHGPAEPVLTDAGGFRLDDPQGAVGIEFKIVTETSGEPERTYLVPMTYRGERLEGADHALVGTTEHGVLGKRWVYDALGDPVAVAELIALLAGRVQAQMQSVSDEVDRRVQATWTGPGLPDVVESFTTSDDPDGTQVTVRLGDASDTPCQLVIRLVRALAAGEAPAADGHIIADWLLSDGTSARGCIAWARHR